MLEYEIPGVQDGDVTRSDLVELESLTFEYLQNHFFGAMSSSDILLLDFITIIVGNTTNPNAWFVRVTYESSAIFDPLSPVFPSMDELIMELDNAFTEEELNGYLGMVQALPTTNDFSSTTQVIYEGVDETRTIKSTSSVVTAVSTVAAGFAMFSFGAAYLMYYFRRRRRRREASNRFLNKFTEVETPTEHLSSGKSVDSDDTGSSNGDNNSDKHDPSLMMRLGMDCLNETEDSQSESLSLRAHDCLETGSEEDDQNEDCPFGFDEELIDAMYEEINECSSTSDRSRQVDFQSPEGVDCVSSKKLKQENFQIFGAL